MKTVKNIYADMCLWIIQLSVLGYSTSDLHGVVHSLLPAVKPHHPCSSTENKLSETLQ